MHFYPKPKQECLFAHIDIATGKASWHSKEFCAVIIQTDIVVTHDQVVKLNQSKPIIEHDGWQSARTYEDREKILETALASSVSAALGDKHIDVNGDEVSGVADLSRHLERLYTMEDSLIELDHQQQAEALKAAAEGGTEAFVSTLIFLLPPHLRAAAAEAWAG